MSTLVQTLLASSAQNTLCIVRPPVDLCNGNWVHAHNDFMSRLPNELLAYIFWNMEEHRVPYERHPPIQWLLLTKVCRRWRDIIDTFLYRNLLLRDREENRHSQFLKALNSRKYLCEYPKSLSISIESPVYSKDIVDILDKLTSVREVSFQADFDEPHLPVLRSIATMTLETLYLHGFAGGPSINMLFNVFHNMSALKELHIGRWGWSREHKLHAGRTQDDSAMITLGDLNQLLPLGKRRTAAFTVLGLQDPRTSVTVTECLLHWPARLEELSFKYLCHSPYALEYQTPNLQKLLAVHQHSLKKITIGIIPQRRGGIPNFSDFPNLEELHLSAYQFYHDEDEAPWTAYRKLANPSLRRLVLDFSTEDQHCESWSDFFEDQLEWTADFLDLLGMGFKTNPPETRLRDIHINFNPKLPWRPMELTWPWHWLQEAARVASTYGVSLTYSTPGWTMEDYVKTQEGTRRFNMVMGF